MSGNVLVFRRRSPPPQVLTAEDEAAIARLQLMLFDAGLPVGGLLASPSTDRAPKHLVSDGRRWVWRPMPAHVAVHQLPGFRPFHGVTWMPTPAERAEAARRRRRASHQWLKEIFARG